MPLKDMEFHRTEKIQAIAWSEGRMLNLKVNNEG